MKDSKDKNNSECGELGHPRTDGLTNDQWVKIFTEGGISSNYEDTGPAKPKTPKEDEESN